MTLWVYCETCYLYQPIFLFALTADSFKIFRNASVLVIPFFLSFKGASQTCLLKESMTSNNKGVSILNFLNNGLSAELTPQLLSTKHECTFRFPDFLIIGFCNYLSNSFFSETPQELNSVSLFVLEIFLSKKL